MTLIQRFTRIFSDLKIRNKLILSFFPVTVLIVAAVGFVSYRFAVSTIEKQSLEIVTQAQEQVVTSISRKVDAYQTFLRNIRLTPTIRDILRGVYDNSFYSMDPFEERSKVKDLEDYMRNTQMFEKFSTNLEVIRYNNEYNEIISNNFHDVFDIGINSDILGRHSSDNNVQIFNETRISKKDWYNELRGKATDIIWKQIADDNRFNNISIIQEIPYLTDWEDKVGMLILSVQMESIFNPDELSKSGKSFFHVAFDKGGELLYIDKNRMDFYIANLDSINQYFKSDDNRPVFIQKDTAMIKSSTVSNGWRLISCIPMNMLTREAERIKVTVFLACIAALLLLFTVSLRLSKSFAGRIERICLHMQDFQEGDFNKKLKNIHKDELGYLAQSYNEMTVKTRALIKEVYQANIDKKEAQLKALQAQINPHFLYNSLSSIIRLANRGETDRVEKMAGSLVKFYRMSLNKGRDIILIADELEQVKAYVDIMKIRLGNGINIVYDIEERALKYHTVKLILQPFIENVLEHGIFDRETAINIQIVVRLENDSVVFKVIDDGIGMKIEKLLNILSSHENEDKGYGVKNVDDRIKLQFGNTYGVSLFSKPGIGTVINLRIPRYVP